MSEAEAESLVTEFITLHYSGKDVHLRTEDGILFIDKSAEGLIDYAKQLKRGQSIKATGERIRSKTLSAEVLVLSALEPG